LSRLEALEAAFTAAFGGLAPATRARHLSALRSALAWWAEAGWVAADPTAGWARPKVPVDTTRALTRAQVAAIWRLDVPLRDKALWRMLYETAARAEEILGADVPDLDLPSKRGRIDSKGGTTDWGTGRPAPPCCCPGSWPDGARARCFCAG
jgi:integrase/recombinase XerD